MRTDRELLELAAKAAGMYVLTKKPWPAGEEGWFFNQVGDQPPALYNRRNLTIWSPFADDGDALRLAVNQSILRCHMDMFHVFYDEEIARGLSPSEATRRAFVRAAAEIVAK